MNGSAGMLAGSLTDMVWVLSADDGAECLKLVRSYFESLDGKTKPANPMDPNGPALTYAATYTPGGAPDDVANGSDLTVGDGGDVGDGGVGAERSDAGTGGLLGSTGTSMALVLALGVFAAAMVAGGRTATRRN